MSSNRVRKPNTFWLAFIRRKIAELFKSPMVKAVLLTELRERGPDAAMIIKMLDKVQPVRPVQLPRQQPVANVNVNVVQPQNVNNNVQPRPKPRDGSSCLLYTSDAADE